MFTTSLTKKIVHCLKFAKTVTWPAFSHINFNYVRHEDSANIIKQNTYNLQNNLKVLAILKMFVFSLHFCIVSSGSVVPTICILKVFPKINNLRI